MKLSSGKPISSPGRTDKFPPPLMRFLRTNASSRSRGRTARASPMFMRKKTPSSTSAATAIETTQEPSSPKVTCIGQVRVRRSKSKSGNRRPTTGRGKSATSRCYCVRKSMFCDSIHVKLRRPRSFRPAWREWVFFFRCRTGAKVKTDSPTAADSGRVRVDRFGGINYEEEEEEEEEEGEFREERSRCGGGYVSASSTPPKNAFLLTRCRSAPYRSSSLAGQFWGSPLKTEEEEGTLGGEQEDRERTATDRKESEASPTSGSELVRRDLSAESRGDQESEEEEEEEGRKERGKEDKEEEERGFDEAKEGEEIQGPVNKNEVKGNVSEVRRKFEDSKLETNTTPTCLESRRKSGDIEKSRNGIGGVDDGSSSMRPLILLKRCKSEPARREKFDREISTFWTRQTRPHTESGTPLVVD